MIFLFSSAYIFENPNITINKNNTITHEAGKSLSSVEQKQKICL